MQEKNIETLVINKVENQKVYDAMVAANKINNNELYLVGGGEQVTGVKGDKETAFRAGDVNLTASNIGALAEDTPVIKYTEQTLDDGQKIQARTNIGAGTSSFSGQYNDLTGTPPIVYKDEATVISSPVDIVYDSRNTFGIRINPSYRNCLLNISQRDDGFGINLGTNSTTNNGAVIINGVATPTDDNHAANKKYVDDAIANNTAERNTIVTIKRNGTALTPTDRVVDITVPTKTSDLTNDSDFATNSSVDTKLANKVTVVSGKGLSTEDYTSAEKTKLSGIATGAEVNQNAFSNIVVGKTTVAADSKTDTLTLISGSNVTLTPDATNDTITIAAIDTVYTHPTYTRTNATSTTAPDFGKTFTAIDSITTNNLGHVTAINTKTITLPVVEVYTEDEIQALWDAAQPLGIFTIADDTSLNFGYPTGNYQFEIGMTFADWARSSYNTIGAISADGNVGFNDASYDMVCIAGASEKIVDGQIYTYHI